MVSLHSSRTVTNILIFSKCNPKKPNLARISPTFIKEFKSLPVAFDLT